MAYGGGCGNRISAPPETVFPGGGWNNREKFFTIPEIWGLTVSAGAEIIFSIFETEIPVSVTPPSLKKQLGTPADSGPRTWVQTERSAHEAWAKLSVANPRAASIMHNLVAMMGHQNAVVISQKALAKICGCTDRTIRNAIPILVKEKWIQVIQIGSSSTVLAYVVNSAVAWGEKREHIGSLAVFQAKVIADASEQGDLTRAELRRVPLLFHGEQQLPSGDGEPPPSQPSFGGLEPDLPARRADHDPETGEVIEPPRSRKSKSRPAAVVRAVKSESIQLNLDDVSRVIRWLESDAVPEEVQFWHELAIRNGADSSADINTWASIVSPNIVASGVLD